MGYYTRRVDNKIEILWQHFMFPARAFSALMNETGLGHILTRFIEKEFKHEYKLPSDILK